MDGTFFYGKRFIRKKYISDFSDKCGELEGRQISIFASNGEIILTGEPVLKVDIAFDAALAFIMFVPAVSVFYSIITGDNLIFRIISSLLR